MDHGAAQRLLAGVWLLSCARPLFQRCVVSFALAAATSAGLANAQDKAPSLKQFPADVGKSFTALWSSDNRAPLLAGAAATAGAIAADEPMTRFFHDGSRWRGFDGVGKHLGKSQFLGPAAGLALLASRAGGDERFKKFTYSLAQGFVVTSGITGGVKVLTGRQRPDRASHSSFPSGHTSNTFMWATVVSQQYGWKSGAPAFAFAAYVGASRLKSRKHYLTDVVAGATLGYIVGRTVTRDSDKARQRRFRVGVAVPPGGGAAVHVGIRAW